MTDSAIANIHVNRIYSQRFGGLDGVQLDLGDSGFVVVHGPNEAGKTRYATLLSWLLVGPTGDGGSAERFGRREDELSGKLEGRFGDDPLKIEAKFTLLAQRLPNTNGMAITKGFDQMKIDQWRTVLNGIDPKVLTAIYRLWGADLHSDEQVMEEIAQSSMAGLPGSRRISVIVGQLTNATKNAISTRAVGTSSWTKLLSEAETKKGELRTLQTNAVSHLKNKDRLEEIDTELRELRSQRQEAGRKVESFKALSDVVESRGKLDGVDEDLRALEEIPEEWTLPLNSLDELDSVSAQIDQLNAKYENDSRGLIVSAASLGIEENTLYSLTVTSKVATDLHVLNTKLSNHNDSLRAAEQARHEAELQRDKAVEGADEALTDARVTEDDLKDLRLGAEQISSITRALNSWRTAEEICYGTTDDSEKEEEAAAESAFTQAREAWERYGTGLDPEKWQASSAHSTSVSARNIWVAPVAAAVSLLAVVGLPRWPAVGVVAAMVVAVVYTTIVRPRPVATSGEPSPQMSAAAVAMITAGQALDSARTSVVRRATAIQLSQEKRDAQREKVAALLSDLPIEVGSTADVTELLLEALRRAIDAASASATANATLLRAEAAVTAAKGTVEQTISEIQQHLRDAGLPETLTWEYAVQKIDEIQALCTKRDDLTVAGQKIESLANRFDDLIAPVSDVVSQMSRAAILTEAHRLSKIRDQRTALVNSQSELNSQIRTRIGSDETAKALANEGYGPARINEELDSLESDIEQIDAKVGKLNEERGLTKGLIDQLEQSDQVAALQLQVGELEDLATDQLLEGVVRSIARSLIQTAVAERRRTHQPAIVARASEMLSSVAPQWDRLMLDPTDNGSAELSVLAQSGLELGSQRLSTGARALVLLALRLANAEIDAERRRVRFPLICDDPLVHFDDQRAESVMPLFAHAAALGHQVILFTCHSRTVKAAQSSGAALIELK